MIFLESTKINQDEIFESKYVFYLPTNYGFKCICMYIEYIE